MVREMILRGTHWAFIRWGQLVQPLWKTMWRFLRQFNTIWPSNSTLRYVPKRNENT